MVSNDSKAVVFEGVIGMICSNAVFVEIDSHSHRMLSFSSFGMFIRTLDIF